MVIKYIIITFFILTYCNISISDINYYIYDDGNKNTYISEENDCVVRSLSIFLDIPYDTAYKNLAIYRQPNHKININDWRYYKHNALPNMKMVRFSNMTLGKFCRQYPIGKWLVDLRGHTTVVIDGIVHDTTSLNKQSQIYVAWRKIK